MIKKTILLALVIGLLLTAIGPASIEAQGALTITSSSTRMQFPTSIVFNVSAKSNANITDVRLHYRMEQLSFAEVTSESFVDIVPAPTINTQWTWDMRKTGGLPPGTMVDYWWTVTDEQGNRVETSLSQLQFNDNRYSWRTLVQGRVTLYWYNGNDSFARELMTAVQQALQRLEQDTGARLEQPVRLYIYGDSRDLQGAMVFPQEWTGGAAFTEEGIMIIGISPSILDWGKTAITHEMTHLVIHQMTFNPYNSLPTWLDEGLAMYNQGPLTAQFTGPLNSAIRGNTLISVRSLSSPFSAFGDIANLSYAESFSIVQYLISKYGQGKMSDLLLAFKEGSTYDGALQKVYGFDMDGLNAEWRSAIGAAAPAKVTARARVPRVPLLDLALLSPGLRVLSLVRGSPSGT